MAVEHLKRLSKEEMAVARAKGQESWNKELDEFIQQTTEQIRGYLRGVPDSSKKVYVRALSKKLSTFGAIKAKCLDCSSFQKEEISECSVKTCPLYAYRPYQKKK